MIGSDPAGRVHILKEPISQFFRKIIAEDQGNVEKYNYKTNPDITLTLKTVKTCILFLNNVRDINGGRARCV